MFTLTPLAVALQGIGYGTLLESLQGLVAVTIAPTPKGAGFWPDLRRVYEPPPPRRVAVRSIGTAEAFGVPRVTLKGRSRERRRAEELSLLSLV